MDGPPFVCPECKDAGKGKDAEFSTYQRRYHHRRKAHGIKPRKPGQWEKMKARDALKAKSAGKASANALVHSPRNGHLKIAREHDATNPQVPLEIFAHTSGKIENLILDVAAKHDLPPKQFARGCIEYILYTAGWK